MDGDKNFTLKISGGRGSSPTPHKTMGALMVSMAIEEFVQSYEKHGVLLEVTSKPRSNI